MGSTHQLEAALQPRPLGQRTLGYRAFDLAFHVVMRLADRVCDAWYGVATCDEQPYAPDDLAPTRHRDPSSNMPSYYLRLFALRRALRPGPDDVVVDLGCGDGRALFVLSRTKAHVVRGVDADIGCCARAEANIRRFGARARAPISILAADAASYRFSDETIVYLFNPFGPTTLAAVLGELHASLALNPRRVRIAYYFPKHRNVLDSQPWLKRAGLVRGFKTDVVVWENRSG